MTTDWDEPPDDGGSRDVLAGHAGPSGRLPDAEHGSLTKSPSIARIFFFLGSIAFLLAAGYVWSRSQTPLAPPSQDNRRAREWLSPQQTIHEHIHTASSDLKTR
jgi:hypothetical protein